MAANEWIRVKWLLEIVQEKCNQEVSRES